jgi:type II restriction/modification system DNA methylase subunit YeeA
MVPAEFKTKWAKFSGKESAAYQEHFNDLCRMLGLPTPIEADPTANDRFCFQKRVAKDAELFDFDAEGKAEPADKERGFADVWKRDCFGWEYKGSGEDLDKAYKQLLRYRESLLNPPLLIVCDFNRYIVRTNFNGAVQETHTFTNAEIDSPVALRVLRAALADPETLRPRETTADVTEKLAQQIAGIARSLQDREAIELASAKTRKEHVVAQKKNLRIARFLNRLVFCFFAEDTGLLPENIFAEVCAAGVQDPISFAETLEDLFRCMAKGGRFGTHKIRHFNGHLFEDSTVFELTAEEIQQLGKAAAADWQSIRPAIMGNLFERGLDPDQRAQLGAHYTSEEDIRTLVEPVLMAPLRREWQQIRRDLAPLLAKGKATNAARDTLAAFQKKLAGVTVLDPACGSGNFLYIALQLLLTLEKQVITAAAQLGFTFTPQVSVQQLRAIELNAYAFELAQVSVQIGLLQWRRDNGFDNDRSPVLQNLDGFENVDALFVPHFGRTSKTLKEAQAEEHTGDTFLKSYTEREWPKCDVIVGNPPFLGNKRLRTELGDAYTKSIFEIFGDRLPASSDFCCYWFEKARHQIEDGKCKRAGLLGTTGSKQISSRRAFERIRETGKLFFAISDRDWFDKGTAIRICMVGFAGPDAKDKATLDGNEVAEINADLTSGLDTTGKQYLRANKNLCFMGTTKVGNFDIPQESAIEMLSAVNPHGKPNSDVLRPFRNGSDLVQNDSRRWIVDFGVGTLIEAAALYEAPFKHVVECVKPEREKNNDKWRRKHWWLLGRTLPDFREATAALPRYIGTARVAKHRIFIWQDSPVLPDSKVIAIAFADDFRFGVLHSRLHEVWTLATCGWHGKGNDATYNPTECFETFPFPFANDLRRRAPDEEETSDSDWDEVIQRRFLVVREASPAYGGGGPKRTPKEHRAAIAAAAKELNELRERWLNPPEWTQTRTLEFPGTVGGPWDRYIVPESKIQNPQSKIGLVRYPRLEPRDAECAAKLAKRTLTTLYNERPAWLDLAHKKLDAAVAAAYGWPADLSDDAILEKLLVLNQARAAEEAKAAKVKPSKPSRAKQADEML